MKNKIRGLNALLWLIGLGTFVILSCQEKELAPVGGKGDVPGPVSNVVVTPGPGVVKLTYDLPDAKDLLYVKAVVMVNGVEREVKASFYENQLEIKGFGDVNTYEVSLYAVSRSEVMSEPVRVSVVPDTPPLLSTFESLEIFADFGGATVGFSNEAEGELNIVVL